MDEGSEERIFYHSSTMQIGGDEEYFVGVSREIRKFLSHFLCSLSWTSRIYVKHTKKQINSKCSNNMSVKIIPLYSTSSCYSYQILSTFK